MTAYHQQLPPDSFEVYFKAQGATLEYQVVEGQNRYSLVVDHSGALYSLGCMSYGWTSPSDVWEDWCAQQRLFFWHKLCAQALCDEAYKRGPTAVKNLHWWSRTAGVARNKKQRITWPWTSISRRDHRSLFDVKGSPWDTFPLANAQLQVSELINACVDDQFNIKRPCMYIRAFSQLLQEQPRIRLERIAQQVFDANSHPPVVADVPKI